MVDAGKVEVEVGMDATPYEQGGQKVIRTNEGILRSYEDFKKTVEDAGLSIDETTGKVVESTKATKEADKATGGLNTAMINLSSGLYVAEKGYDYLTKIYNQFIGSTMAQVSALESLQRQTGMTWQETQRWKEVTEDLGVDMGYLAYSMRNFSIHMSQATVKTSEAGKTFKDLGVEVKNSNGTMRNTNEVFIDTLSALQKMPNETRRNQIAMQLYGRSWFELSKLMQENVDIKKRLAEADPVMTEAEKNQVKAATQAFRDWNNSMDRLTTTIGVRLMPMFTALMNFLNNSLLPAIIGALDRVEYLGYKFAHISEKISFKEYVTGRDAYRASQLAGEAAIDTQNELNDSMEEGNRIRDEALEKDNAWLTSFLNKSRGYTPEGEVLAAGEKGESVQKQATDILGLLKDLNLGVEANEQITGKLLANARERMVLLYKDIHGISYKQFTEQTKLINEAEIAEINSHATALASLMTHLKDKTKLNEDYVDDMRNLQEEAAQYEELIFATKNQKLMDMWNDLKSKIEAGDIDALITISQKYQEVKGGAPAGGWPAGGITKFGPMGWEGSEMASFFKTAMKVFADQGIEITQEIYNQILQAWGTGQLIPGQRLANQGPEESLANTKKPVVVDIEKQEAKIENATVTGTGWKFTGEIQTIESLKDTNITSESAIINPLEASITNEKDTTITGQGDVILPGLNLTVQMPQGKETTARGGGWFGSGTQEQVSNQGLIDAKGRFFNWVTGTYQTTQERAAWEKEHPGMLAPLEPKASGGPTQTGKPYLVGEKGAELFVPSQNGTVVPQEMDLVSSLENINETLVDEGVKDREKLTDIKGMFEENGEKDRKKQDNLFGTLQDAVAKVADVIFGKKEPLTDIGGMFSPIEKRAKGGPTEEGKPYVVGEKGAELFVPGENGTIVPFASNNNNWIYTPGAGGIEAGEWTAKMLEGMDYLDIKDAASYWKKYEEYLTSLGISPKTVLKKNLRTNEKTTFSDTGAWKLTDFYEMDESVGISGNVPSIYPTEFTNLWGERLKIDESKPWGIQNPLKGSMWDLSVDKGKRYTDMALNTLGFRYPKLVQKYPFFRDTDSNAQAFDTAWYMNNPGKGMPPDVEKARMEMQEENKIRSLSNQTLGPAGIEQQGADFARLHPGMENPYERGATSSNIGVWDDATVKKLEEERRSQLSPEVLDSLKETSDESVDAVAIAIEAEKGGYEIDPSVTEKALKAGWIPATDWFKPQKKTQGGFTFKPMQFGGPVLKDNRYLVGEQGPELFVPSSTSISNVSSSEKVVNIIIELDGEVIAKKIAAPLVGEIRVRTGVKF